MVGGLARLGEHRVMVVGTQKGRDTKENIRRNFGSAHPEGYRLMERLTTFSARPVVDVQLVHSARPEADPYADPWFGAAPPPSRNPAR